MEIMDLVYIILAVLLVVILIILAMYNKLITLYNKFKKAKANIEIYLNKRFDLINNLVECVKSYSKYESETLEEVVSLRSSYQKQKDLNIREVEAMNDRLNSYLAIIESYPDLKANTQYLNLQEELEKVEAELARTRHIYNDEVTQYNILIEKVPSNIVASLFAFKKAELFHVENDKRDNIKINM